MNRTEIRVVNFLLKTIHFFLDTYSWISKLLVNPTAKKQDMRNTDEKNSQEKKTIVMCLLFKFINQL